MSQRRLVPSAARAIHKSPLSWNPTTSPALNESVCLWHMRHVGKTAFQKGPGEARYVQRKKRGRR